MNEHRSNYIEVAARTSMPPPAQARPPTAFTTFILPREKEKKNGIDALKQAQTAHKSKLPQNTKYKQNEADKR